MRAVIQRVTEGSVTVDNEVVSSIRRGLVVLLGIAKGDTAEDVDFLANKIAALRIFEDQQDKMNLSLLDIGGEVLVVSQFTLAADIKKGRRPGFDTVASPDEAERLYELFVDKLREKGLKTETGIFQAKMIVRINNDGPVTFVVDSRLPHVNFTHATSDTL